MKIYVASSWRCARQPEVVVALREAGHDVYDFKNPGPGDNGFGWRQVTDVPQPWSAEQMREVLKHPIARAGFEKDMAALTGADATVLVLPCGRSAHLELGLATGAGQRTYVLLDDPISEPELMYLMNTKICVSIGEVVEELARVDRSKPTKDRPHWCSVHKMYVEIPCPSHHSNVCGPDRRT